MYDVTAVRAHFPALDSGIAFFDGPGGTQTPTPVARAMSEAMLAGLSNRDRLTPTGRRADDIVTSAREAMADLLGADAAGVVFGRSMTSLTYDLARTLSADWGPQDEIVVTSLDHDANVRPWVQAAQAVGAQVRWAHFDPDTAELPLEAVTAVLSPRTRVVALTGASNVLGTRPDVTAVATAAHQQGAYVFLDAVHLAPHVSIDMAELDVDFVACSPYKFFGPHLGVLAGVPETLESLQPAKLLPSPARIPERFEVGTLPYEALAGVSAAVDFIADLSGEPAGTRRERLVLSYAEVGAHERGLQARLEEGLDQLPTVRRYSRARHRTPTAFLRVAGVDGIEVSRRCAEAGVNAPCSNFYAIEASRRLGLGDEGAIRAGIAAYTTTEDVDRLVAGVHSAAELVG